MRHKLGVVLVALFGLPLAVPAAVQASDIVTVVVPPPPWYGWVSQEIGDAVHLEDAALDSHGEPHVVYFENGNEQPPVLNKTAYGTPLTETYHWHLRYAWRENGQWQITSFPGENLNLGAIAIDAQDHVFAVVGQGGSGPHGVVDSQLYFATLQGDATWSMELIDTIDLGRPHLALDHAGRPHMTCATDLGVRYYYRDSSGWHHEDLADSTIRGNDIAIDSSDIPHVVFGRQNNNYLGLTIHAVRNGANSWTYDEVGPGAGYPSIAIDQADGIHVSHQATGLQYGYKPAGGNWTDTTADNNGNTGWYTSIAVDSHNRPHISYSSADPFGQNVLTGNLMYATPTDAGWMIESPHITDLAEDNTVITVDHHDVPKIFSYENEKKSLVGIQGPKLFLEEPAWGVALDALDMAGRL